MIKFIAISILGVIALIAGTTVATGVYLVSGGIAHVEVETDDVDLNLPLPTRLADIGLMVARVCVPAEERQRWHREMEASFEGSSMDFSDFSPMVEDLGRQLHALPEGDYVTVDTGSEHVRIGKRRGQFEVFVDAPDTRVRVRFPSRAARRLTKSVSSLLSGPVAVTLAPASL